MKTSMLLLTGLALAIGTVGAARATDATSSCHQAKNTAARALTASASSHGVLATLADLAAEKQEKAAAQGRTTHTPDAGHAGTHYQHRPGPDHADPRGVGRDDARAVRDGGGGEPPASSSHADDHPTLGWQSLLPGSIQ